jgi:hypothetical protein
LLSFGPRNPGGRAPWAVRLRCSLLIPRPRDGHTRGSRFHDKPLLRGAAGHFNRLLDPGAWGVASPLRLNVDFVVNTALVVKTLQVRQQRRLRELHRLWCWPPAFLPWPRSTWISAMHSHARTSAKIDATLFYVAAFFLLCLSPETARRSSQKK